MKLAGDFLAKFNRLTPPNDAVKKALVNAIRQVVDAPLQKKEISFSNGIAFIRCSSIIKSAILVQRGKILSELYREMPKARDLIRDVR